MRITRLLPVLTLTTFFVGCAHQRQFISLSEQELPRCKQVALETADSSEAWGRLQAKRLTKEPFKFDASRVTYEIDFDHPDRITVIIPSGGTFGWHPCYVGVTITRCKMEALEMYESFWP